MKLQPKDGGRQGWSWALTAGLPGHCSTQTGSTVNENNSKQLQKKKRNLGFWRSQNPPVSLHSLISLLP